MADEVTLRSSPAKPLMLIFANENVQSFLATACIPITAAKSPDGRMAYFAEEIHLHGSGHIEVQFKDVPGRHFFPPHQVAAIVAPPRSTEMRDRLTGSTGA